MRLRTAILVGKCRLPSGTWTQRTLARATLSNALCASASQASSFIIPLSHHDLGKASPLALTVRADCSRSVLSQRPCEPCNALLEGSCTELGSVSVRLTTLVLVASLLHASLLIGLLQVAKRLGVGDAAACISPGREGPTGKWFFARAPLASLLKLLVLVAHRVLPRPHMPASHGASLLGLLVHGLEHSLQLGNLLSQFGVPVADSLSSSWSLDTQLRTNLLEPRLTTICVHWPWCRARPMATCCPSHVATHGATRVDEVGHHSRQPVGLELRSV